MKPKITIGIPVFNEENTIKKCLISVISSADQLKESYEIITCFNGTTDKSRDTVKEIAANHPIKIIESQKGKPKAIKSIVDCSLGEYLIFCDADVVVDTHCYHNLIRNFADDSVKAVTGCPIPWPKDDLIYKILNARMLHPKSEIARRPIDNNKEKPFIHGRCYAIKKDVFLDSNIDNFENALGDDTYLTHLLIKKYGRGAIFRELESNVNYLPVQSVSSWWHKWSRIWGDLDLLYKKNPEFKELKKYMQTKIDWEEVRALPPKTQICFVLERALHYAGKSYFNLTKQFKKTKWKRLDDTKVIPDETNRDYSRTVLDRKMQS